MSSYNVSLTDYQKKELIKIAWKARMFSNARKTKVGCSLLTYDGYYYSGCNFEHDFCKSIHAELAALINMAVYTHKAAVAILVVSEMKKFTPCGDCMDWIKHFGIDGIIIGYQSIDKEEPIWYKFEELMPHYPQK